MHLPSKRKAPKLEAASQTVCRWGSWMEWIDDSRLEARMPSPSSPMGEEREGWREEQRQVLSPPPAELLHCGSLSKKDSCCVSHPLQCWLPCVCWYTYVSGCFRKFMFGFSRLMKNGGALSCSGIIAHSLFWSLVPLSVFVVSSLDTFTHFLFFTHALLMGHKTSWRTHSVAGTLLQYHAWWNLDVSLFVPQTNKPPTVPFLLPLHLIIWNPKKMINGPKIGCFFCCFAATIYYFFSCYFTSGLCCILRLSTIHINVKGPVCRT